MFTKSYITKLFLLPLLAIQLLPVKSDAQNSYRYSVQYSGELYFYANSFTMGTRITSFDKLEVKISTGFYFESITEPFYFIFIPFITELQYPVNKKKDPYG